MKGGGWCNNVTTCLDRTKTRLGSSKQMAEQVAFSGILHNEQQYNPGNNFIPSLITYNTPNLSHYF